MLHSEAGAGAPPASMELPHQHSAEYSVPAKSYPASEQAEVQLSIVLLETAARKGSVLPPALSLVREDKVRNGWLTMWLRTDM